MIKMDAAIEEERKFDTGNFNSRHERQQFSNDKKFTFSNNLESVHFEEKQNFYVNMDPILSN